MSDVWQLSLVSQALVGAGLAAGFALTNSLIKAALPGAPSNSDRGSSGRQSSFATKRPEVSLAHLPLQYLIAVDRKCKHVPRLHVQQLKLHLA